MWILFPNQLFSKDILKTIPNWEKETYVLWEDPLFYGIRPDSKAYKGSLKLNTLRIIYQKWLWLNYIDYLKSLKLTIHIQSYETSSIQQLQSWIAKSKTHSIQCFDPEDTVLKERWKKLPIQWHDSPMFLVSSEKIQHYYASLKSNKRLQHGHFYDYVKENVLHTFFPSVKIPTSKDTENRKPFPSNEKLPELPYSNESKSLPSNLQKANEWCDIHFPKNPGPLKDQRMHILQTYLVHLPSNAIEAKQWWIQYRKSRFSKFGPYEDAIVSNQPILYHSFCAMLLNFGLLTPREVLQDLFQYYSFESSSKELVSTLEGFVRQLAGWREFSRLYYRVISPIEYRKNIFHHTKRLSKEWYTPNSSNRFPEIVQEAIRDAWNTGYLHHIRRLMIVSNYMNLSYIHPEQMYKWMYEFSLDSWEWVMVFNVYSMGSWSDGGLAMRKPYVSSSAYLLKMSNTSSGPWVNDWKEKYTDYLKHHRDILKHTIYAYQLNKL
jgi:deoxyribodipyrimidine photolyase-related protein